MFTDSAQAGVPGEPYGSLARGSRTNRSPVLGLAPTRGSPREGLLRRRDPVSLVKRKLVGGGVCVTDILSGLL